MSPTGINRVADAVADCGPGHLPTGIEGYRVLEAIGSGGMGVVYRAEQEHPIRRTVALKLIKPGMDSREIIARFESERQALAMMNHPNVARVLNAGATDLGRPYFVMEYVPGEAITRFSDCHRLSLTQRLELFVQACEAVQHAHQKAILHRDLKPSNILVTEESGQPQVKVIDFGVAKALSQPLTEHTLVTESGQLLGTPEYMSPEQAVSGADDVDTRSDIYSLGVVLYELLTGALPFESRALRSSGVAQLQRIIREIDPPRPSTRLGGMGEAAVEIAAARQSQLNELTKQLRSELEWIPLKAMRKEGKDRYASAGELIADIRNYLEHRPLMAGPESRSYRLRKFVWRNKGAVAAVTSIAAALWLGLAAALVGFAQARQERDRALTAETQAETNLQTARVEAARSAQVAQFMTDMLNGVGPSVARGRDTTMLREILDRTVERLDQLKDHPDVEADLRMTVANVYDALGDFPRTQAMYGRALQLRRQLHSGDDPKLAAALITAGLWVDDAAEGEAMLREAVAMRQRLYGAEHPLVAHAVHQLGQQLYRKGRYADAEPVMRQVQAMQRELRHDPSASASPYALGELLFHDGRINEAAEYFRETWSLDRQLNRDHDPQLLDALGRVLYWEGDHQEASTMFKDCLSTSRTIYGDGDHWLLVQALTWNAFFQHVDGRLEEAERLAREASDMHRRICANYGFEFSVLSQRQLAAILAAQGKASELQKLSSEVRAMLQDTQPELHADRIHVLDYIAHALLTLGDYAEAEAAYRDAIRALRATPVEEAARQDLLLGQVLHHVAALLHRRNELTEARALAEQAMALYQAHPERSPERRHAQHVLLAVLRSQSDWGAVWTVQRDLLKDILDRWSSSRSTHVVRELGQWALGLVCFTGNRARACWASRDARAPRRCCSPPNMDRAVPGVDFPLHSPVHWLQND